MKILIISDAWFPQINGVVRTYENIIPDLEKMGHTIKVIGPSDFPFTLPMPGYSEIKLAIFSYARLKTLIDDFKPDTIHLATEGPLGLAGQKYCRHYQYVFSTCYHTQFPDYIKARVEKIFPFLAPFFYKLAIKKITKFHNQSNAVLITTQSIKEQLLAWNITAPLFFFTRGVNKDYFFPKQASIKDHHTFPSSLPDDVVSLKKPIALYVGRIAIEKNIEDFLKMPWHGSKMVVGHGPDLDTLIKHYPDVLFAGKKTGLDLGNYYRASDVFVFPSKTDTFGMVIIEALACGLPVAAYPVSGPKDIITQDYLGALNDNLSVASSTALDNTHYQERIDHINRLYQWDKAALDFIAASPVIKRKES